MSREQYDCCSRQNSVVIVSGIIMSAAFLRFNIMVCLIATTLKRNTREKTSEKKTTVSFVTNTQRRLKWKKKKNTESTQLAKTTQTPRAYEIEASTYGGRFSRAFYIRYGILANVCVFECARDMCEIVFECARMCLHTNCECVWKIAEKYSVRCVSVRLFACRYLASPYIRLLTDEYMLLFSLSHSHAHFEACIIVTASHRTAKNGFEPNKWQKPRPISRFFCLYCTYRTRTSDFILILLKVRAHSHIHSHGGIKN